MNKNNNIKVLKNKGRNKNNKNIIKCLKNKYSNDGDEKENTVFIRRIILEEKFTIDSKGDKKTIYIKEVSPIFQSSDIVNSADKRLIKIGFLISDFFSIIVSSSFSIIGSFFS